MRFLRKHKEKIIGISLSVAVSVICLIVGELVLGMILPNWGYFRYQADEDLGFRLEPSDKAMVNELGFRDRLYPMKKSKGVFRIVGLGDSQTVSCGFTDISNAYLKILENNLNLIESSPWKYEILNMGVPNYAPHNYLAMLKKHGIKYDPDLVMVGFFIGNDIQMAPQDRKYIIFDGALLSKQAMNLDELSEFELKVWKWFHERKIYRVIQRAKYARIWTADGDTTGRKLNRLSIFLKDNARTQSDKIEIEKAWSDVQTSLSQIRTMALQINARLLIVLIPEEYQVNEYMRTITMQEWNYSNEDYDFQQWNQKLASFCSDNQIELIDPIQGFSKVIKHERLYFKNDTHLNENGHRLLAQSIQDFVVKISMTDVQRDDGEL